MNIKVNRKLSFFPKVIKISSETYENTFEGGKQKQNGESSILRKAEFPCDDPFIYQVLFSKKPLQVEFISILTLILSINYILDELLIDEFRTAVKPFFIENVFNMDGLLGLVKINVIIIYKTNSKINLFNR